LISDIVLDHGAVFWHNQELMHGKGLWLDQT
jgi:hypothetical protein